MPLVRITDRDTAEVVRDRIASILVAEIENQKALAAEAGDDPSQYDLRIFLESRSAWALYGESYFTGEAAPAFAEPITNISLRSVEYDQSSTNTHLQLGTATYELQIFAAGVSRESDDGHVPGDLDASLRLQRAVRVARKILSAGTYTTLRLPQVRKSLIASIQYAEAVHDKVPIPRLATAIVTLAVDIEDTSPQVQGQPLEGGLTRLLRHPSGQVYLEASWGTPPSSSED